jgi:hypothetical protein
MYLNSDKKNLLEWKNRNRVNKEVYKGSFSLGLYHCALLKWGCKAGDSNIKQNRQKQPQEVGDILCKDHSDNRVLDIRWKKNPLFSKGRPTLA